MTRAFKQGFLDMMQKIADGTGEMFWTNSNDEFAMPSAQTYFGQLARNTSNPSDFTGQAAWHSSDPATRTLFGAGTRLAEGDIAPSAEDRKWQAGANAGTMFGINSPEWEAVQKNLENAGRVNADTFTSTKKVPQRKELDTTGIENIQLTDEQRKQLLQMQNTMASNGGQQFGAMA